MSQLKYTDVPPADALVIENGITYDRWIIGQGTDSDTEYIVHLSEPRFVAKYWDGDPDDAPDAAILGSGSRFSGVSIDIDDCSFYDILWLGEPEHDERTLLKIFKAANDAITRYSFREDGD